MKQLHLIILLLALLGCGSHDRQAGKAEIDEARRLADEGDAPSALRLLQRAEQQAGEDSLQALIQSRMGTLYFDQRLLDRSLQCYRKAYAIDLRLRDTLGLIYDLRDMGNVYRATESRADSCLACFEEARRLALLSGNVPMLRDVESQLTAYHLYRNHLDEARRLLMPALECMDDDNRSALTFMMADYYHRAGQRDSAAFFYRRLLTVGNLYTRMAAHRALAEYSLHDGDSREALRHLMRYEALTDSVISENDAEALRRMSALYDYTLHEQQAARLERRLFVAVVSVVLLVLLGVALAFYYNRRRLHYQLRVQRLEHLLEHYREHHNVEAAQEPSSVTLYPVLEQLQRKLADNQPQPLSDDEWHRLEDAVEAAHPRFICRVQEFCRLTPQQRRVTLLLKVGIQPVGIALLTAHSKQSVSNTRSRLYEKAFGRKGSPAQWDEFIQSL